MEQASMEKLSLTAVRERLGEIWGLGRAITRAELARALSMGKYGGGTIGKLEKDGQMLSGTAEVAIRMMLDGARPHTMDGVIKPGYPRLKA